MHRRNWGLSHLLQRAKRSVGNAHRASAQRVAVRVQYMGRVLFAHGDNTYTSQQEHLAHVGGEK